MASSSGGRESPMGDAAAAPDYFPYPPALAKYEDVIISPNFFMETLEKLHAAMGTKFMGFKCEFQIEFSLLFKPVWHSIFQVPIIGGKDLDLHRLFVEVTSRGGFEKIIRERRWKEVTAVFSFPSTATNASFVLRKYYRSLLYHYEQIYFFKARGWIPSRDSSQSLFSPLAVPQGLTEELVPPPDIPAATGQPRRAEFSPGANLATPTGSPVIGVIDGKFESGYLITVTIGSDKLKGVLYLGTEDPASEVTHHYLLSRDQNVPCRNNGSTSVNAAQVHRRRRRKKSEMKKRDPAHPKPNRSGYNFFFAEQHARLKLLHPGKDREISRMIGELWTKMKEPEKVVYQDIAAKDKERYKMEMECYRERLRTGQIISNAVPIQQLPLELDANIVGTSQRVEDAGGNSPQTPENEVSSKSDMISDSENKTADHVSECETSPGVDVTEETLLDEEGFDLDKRVDRDGDESSKNSEDDPMEEGKKRGIPLEEKGATPSEKRYKFEIESKNRSKITEESESMHFEKKDEGGDESLKAPDADML